MNKTFHLLSHFHHVILPHFAIIRPAKRHKLRQKAMAYWSEISSLFTQFFRLTRLQESTKERKRSPTPIYQGMKHIGRAMGQAIGGQEGGYIGSRRKLYWSTGWPILVGEATYIAPRGDQYRFDEWPIWDCCGRVLFSIYCAKASRTQLPDMPLRSDTQALRLIVSISLIQRREKCPSHEEKSAFT